MALGNTRRTRDAASSNITDYNAFVRSKTELTGADRGNCHAKAGRYLAILFWPAWTDRNREKQTIDQFLNVMRLRRPLGRLL